MTTSPEPVEAALALADSRDNIQSRYEAISRMRSTECIGESETADQSCVRILAAEVRRLRAELAGQPMIATETHVLPLRK